MRRGLLLGAGLGAVNTGVVLILAWALGRSREFGWYSYSAMPRRYADYLAAPSSRVVTGWAAVGLVAGVLIAVNAAVVAAYVLLGRRRAQVDPATG